MTEAIRKWVNACDTCLRVKASNRVTEGLLSPLEIPNAWGGRVNIDFVTKLPMSKSGNDTIVKIIDALTKRVRWFGTKDAELSAEIFARLFLDHYVRAHGIPKAIVTDRDVRFQSTFWDAFTKTLRTNCKFNTTFHPQMDGLAEKANDTIQTFLRAYATAYLNDWDAYLSLAEFTYNAIRHKVTHVALTTGAFTRPRSIGTLLGNPRWEKRLLKFLDLFIYLISLTVPQP
jgi:hypothetical protein